MHPLRITSRPCFRHHASHKADSYTYGRGCEPLVSRNTQFHKVETQEANMQILT